MCGRFVLAKHAGDYAGHFGVTAIRTDDLEPNWNVAPTDPIYAVAEHEHERRLGTFRWGLLPFWAKDRKMAARNINARMETIATKPSFKESFLKRRCIIPADGFYEWERRQKGKLPHFIYAADRSPLALAGIWSAWRDPTTGERVTTCSIITGPPSQLVSPLHDRMPVILPPDTWDRWLDRGLHDPEVLEAVLTRGRETALGEHPVSTLVNKVQNNFPECIVPLDTGAVEGA
jgi:putative SOS response-associated peptidase YedK